MKYLLILCALASFRPSYAQWYQVNTDTDIRLNDLFFINNQEGYCVGGNDDWGAPQTIGVILKTTDGGENWSTIYQEDSLSIHHLAVVQENNNHKLYAFAKKSGTSCLISAFINTPTPNWSVDSIDYYPSQTFTYNDEIYLKDDADYKVKKVQQGMVNQVITPNIVSVFDVNNHGLSYLNDAVDSLFYSPDHGVNISALPYHDFFTVFEQNQITDACIKVIGDTLILKGTYPSSIVYSLNGGNTWDYNYNGGEAASLILENALVLSIHAHSNKVFSTHNFGAQWHEETLSGAELVNLGYCHYSDAAFALDRNGKIFKLSSTDWLGINLTELDANSLTIYPNPAQETIDIKLNNNLEVQSIHLFTLQGQHIKEFNKNEEQISLKGISSGSYLLKLTTQSGIVTKNINVQ